jgi:anaerobic selenocysteine-containing dehydrogenase
MSSGIFLENKGVDTPLPARSICRETSFSELLSVAQCLYRQESEMFVSLIGVYLRDPQQWSRSPINSGIRSNVGQQRGTYRYENWPTAKAILAIGAEVLERLHPTVAHLLPAYEPIVIALMIGCTTLAVRLSSGLNSGK